MKRSSRQNSTAARSRQRSSRTGSRQSRSEPHPLADLQQGRQHGESMLYDPNQNFNYKAQEIRYSKAAGQSGEVMRPDSGGFRVPSSGRSTAGYWSPGAVRIYCDCQGGGAEPYGRILQLAIAAVPHTLVLQTSSEVTLLRWITPPSCDFTGADFEPVAFAGPDDNDVVTFEITPVGNPYYSFETLGGCSSEIMCARVMDLEPNSTILKLM